MDEDGYVFLVDRKKDLIKTSGFQVWPREIEEVISRAPGGDGGGRGRRARRRQGRGGQGLGGAEGGRSRPPRTRFGPTAASGWRPTRCPRSVEFRTDLPKTMVGKILRRALGGDGSPSVLIGATHRGAAWTHGNALHRAAPPAAAGRARPRRACRRGRTACPPSAPPGAPSMATTDWSAHHRAGPRPARRPHPTTTPPGASRGASSPLAR